MTKRAWFGIKALAVGLVVAAGCGGGGGGGNVGPQKPRLFYVNASPDAGSLDFYVDDSRLATSIGYLGKSPAYRRTDAVLRDLAITPAGSQEQLVAETFTFANDTYYALVAYGLRSFGSEDRKRLQQAEITFDPAPPAAGDTARIIVINAFLRPAGLDTPAIDFRSPGDNPQINVSNVAFGASSAVEVDSVPQQFVVRRNGTEKQYVPPTVGQTIRFTPQRGRVYLAIVTGIEGQTGSSVPQVSFVELPPKED